MQCSRSGVGVSIGTFRTAMPAESPVRTCPSGVPSGAGRFCSTSVAFGGRDGNDRIPLIRWFSELRNTDVRSSAARTPRSASCTRRSAEGVRVPNGFALAAQAYREALTASGCVASAACGCSIRSTRPMSRRWRSVPREAREIVYDATGTEELRAAIAAGLSQSSRSEYGAERGGRGAQLGHRRGPADRELRRPARELSERPRRGGSVRGVPALLRLAVHRSRRSSIASITASTISRSRCRSA